MTNIEKQHTMKDGTWCTMLTPFTRENQVDYKALGELVDWYIDNGVDGLFAVCQSSEMFYLSPEEREAIGHFVVKQAAGRVPIVISGHVSDSLAEQIAELKRADACHPDAVVLVTNRLAAPEEDDEIWEQNAQRILEAMPETRFGLYECPYPYKRLISPKTLKWCADTGRFIFLKDTCCDMEQIQAKLAAIKGTGLKLFNANSATLLDSMRVGASGFCGVMLNFFPKPFSEICIHACDPSWSHRVELLQNFATVASLIELQLYPSNAKYHLSRCGLSIQICSRSRDESQWNHLREIETDGVRNLYQNVMALFDSMEN